MSDELKLAVLVLLALLGTIFILMWAFGETTALILGLFFDHGWGWKEKVVIGFCETIILMLWAIGRGEE